MAKLGEDGKLKSLKQVEELIDENTICVIVSAPAIATGRIEPAEDIAQIALKHQIGCHVDSSLGFFVPFLEEVGIEGF